MITFSDAMSEKDVLAYEWGEGRFFGGLANEWGIEGEKQTAEQFERLVYGQHPVTGEQLIKRSESYETTNKFGKTITTQGHRAGVDMVIRPPKWFSILAYNSGDPELKREMWKGHVWAATKAAQLAQEYACARLSGGKYEKSGNVIATVYHHHRARPDDEKEHAAPMIHSHFFLWNMTKAEDGRIRSMNEKVLFEVQRYLTGAYRMFISEFSLSKGIELEVDRKGVPHAVGIPREYEQEMSPRRAQVLRQAEGIMARMRERGQDVEPSAAINKAAAHQYREGKDFDEEKMEALDAAMEVKYKEAAHKLGESMAIRGPIVRTTESIEAGAREAVAFAVNHLSATEAVYDLHNVLRHAFEGNCTKTTHAAIKAEVERRTANGELVPILREEKSGLPEQTTRRMVKVERDNVARLLAGNGKHVPLAVGEAAEGQIEALSAAEGLTLNADQHRVVKTLLESANQTLAFQGIAGGGKTTALKVVARAAEGAGFEIVGLGPTGIASKQLAPAGIPHNTLDSFLLSKDKGPTGPRLFILDEASLTGSGKFNRFLRRVRPEDRVILVGDRNQHESIAAGAPFRQAQDAGVQTAWFTKIVRQKEPEYLEVSRRLQAGRIAEGIALLIKQGRVIEVADDDKGDGSARYRRVAAEYAKDPDGNLAVSPDNLGRVAINKIVREKLQKAGIVSKVDRPTGVYINGRSMSPAERQLAWKYERGDVLRYQKGGKAGETEIGQGAYAMVVETSIPSDTENRLTVELENGRRVTYDPRRLYGVEVFRSEIRNFAEGDTVQFRRPHDRKTAYGRRERQAVTSELGTIEKIDGSLFSIRKEDGKLVVLDTSTFKHIDHGYATTSFLSQSLTTPNAVIIHIDTKASHWLVNMRMLKVAATRGVQDIRIVTDSLENLTEAVSRRLDKTIADHAIRETEEWAIKKEAARFHGAMAELSEDEGYNFDDLAPASAEMATEESPAPPRPRQAPRKSAEPVSKEPRTYKQKIQETTYEREAPRSYRKSSKGDWRRAAERGSRACPVCGKGGCAISKDDQVVLCWRVPSEDGRIVETTGAHIHKLSEEKRRAMPVIKEVEVNQYTQAGAKARHEAYDALLKNLGLTSRDRKDLERRGLDLKTIERNGYKTMPDPRHVADLMKKLESKDLRGVPGFFTVTEDKLYKMPGLYPGGVGSWTFNVGAWMDPELKAHAANAGYLIPVRNMEGEIVGFQIRVLDERKYIWLSSNKRENGAKPEPEAHFRGVEAIKQTGKAILVEGILKTDVAFHLLGERMGMIGIAGVNVFGDDFGRELREKIPGLREVVVAYDMDKLGNDKVDKALKRLHANLREAGIKTSNLEWDLAKGKGLDDYLLAAPEHVEEVRAKIEKPGRAVEYKAEDRRERKPRPPQAGYRM